MLHYPQPLCPFWLKAYLSVLLLPLSYVLFATNCLAQITPDDTLGAERSQVIPTGPSNAEIDAGARRGGNLFHSFSEFNVPNRGSVYFRNPEGVERILSRVTGTDVSDILGTLGVLGNADLFLLNPNGIIFGPNAWLDVRGAFLATTANGFTFGDGSEFSAVNPQAPALLTVNVPIGLQYGANPAGAITSQGNFLLVDEGRSLILAGGAVNLDNSFLAVDFFEGGRIELGAVGGAGAIGLSQIGNQWSLTFPDTVPRSDILMTNGSRLDVIAENGGDIAIYAQNIDMTGESVLVAGISRDSGFIGSQAGNAVLNATEEIRLQSSDIRNNVSSTAIGNGGDINITTGTLQVSGGAQLSAFTFGQGDAGNVIIHARDRILFENGNAFSRVASSAEGDGGNVEIITGTLQVSGGSGLSASTFGQGDAGNVSITARDRILFENGDAFSNVASGAVGNGGNVSITTGTLQVSGGAQLVANTRGQGDAGNVSITARDRVLFEGRSADGQFGSAAFSSVSSGAEGNGGNVEITTGTLQVSGGAQLSASTFGQGDAGNVSIIARNRVLFENGDAFSNVASGAVGNGGNVSITTGTLQVSGGAQLIANTRGQGDAGNVSITARDRVLFEGTSADGEFGSGAASSVASGAVGNGGNVEIHTGTLQVSGGAGLSASTSGRGDAGNVSITARDRVVFEGRSADGRFGSDAFSRVASGAVGNGGNVEITTGTLQVSGGAQLIANTLGQGNAGNVSITARDRVLFKDSAAFSSVESGAVGNGGNVEITTGTLQVSGGAQLIADTSGQGDAGNVSITARDRITLTGVGDTGRSSALLTLTIATASGGGGRVFIKSPVLLVENGAVINARTDSAQRGGDIRIDADRIVARDGGQLITTTRGSGAAGSIILNADQVILTGVDSTFQQRLEEFGRGRTANEGNGESGLFANTRPDSLGNGGTITIRSDALQLSDQAVISVASSGLNRSGDLTIRANSVTLDEQARITASTRSSRGGNLNLQIADTLSLTNQSEIAATTGTGRGGSLSLNAQQSPTRLVTLDHNSSITTRANLTGDAGDLTLNATTLTLQNNSEISATTRSGVGGDITLLGLETLQVDDSNVSASTLDGVAGSLNLTADRVQLQGQGGLSVRAAAARGSAGSLFVTTDQLDVTNGASVSVSNPNGQAGSLTVRSPEIRLNAGSLTAETGGAGSEQGAEIRLEGVDRLRMNNQSLISAQATAEANGGNVTINANDGYLIANQFENSDIIARAERGNGGFITITAQGILGLEERDPLTPLSDINASSEFGRPGEIVLNLPDVDPAQGLVELPSNVTDATQLIADQCPGISTDGGVSSEFIITGRGGLPPNPYDMLSGDRVFTRLATLETEEEQSPISSISPSPTPSIPPSPTNIVEAQSWYTSADGKVHLVAESPAEAANPALNARCHGG